MKKALFFVLIFLSSSLEAEEIPFFNPYTKTFVKAEMKKTHSSDKLVFYVDNKNEESWSKEFYKNLSDKIEEKFIMRKI